MSLRSQVHRRRAAALLVGIALLGAAGGASAGVAALRNDAELFSLLSASPACCVIDARGETARRAAAIPGALHYQDGLRVKATSHAVVVADTDARALSVARKVAADNPHAVYAAKGGLAAWHAVESRLQAQAAKPGSKFSFIIPHNTCEQGPPLHVFRSEGPAPARSTASSTTSGTTK